MYDARSEDPRCVQEFDVSTDAQPRDHRASLLAAIDALAGGGELETVLDGILQAAVAVVDPTMGAIFISDPDRPGLQPVAVHGMDDAAIASLAAEVADPANPFSVAATSRAPTFDREATLADGSTFVGAYLPLVASARGMDVPVGSMGLGWSTTRTLTDDERETVTALAALAAVAIERARLASTAAERSEWFERMAHTDPLTGLANERTVARILELEIARAGRQGGEVSFAIFDVDDFQATNRESGNDAGDDVLRRVAAALAESVRLVDTVGRIGGDEFVLVAPGSAGMMVAQRILGAIAALPPVAGRPITVSAGVARFPSDAADVDSLIAAAKDGLAKARAEGRGTVAPGIAPGG